MCARALVVWWVDPLCITALYKRLLDDMTISANLSRM